jgi:DNA invertase Pin-like site-specific DNA recombinase
VHVKVVGYLRVSTDRQAEEGLGLDVQRQAIRQWAKVAGHQIVKWTSDEGVSGSNGLGDRIGLADALERLRGKSAAGLVVYRLDRLARDLVLQEQLLAEIWRHGTVVFSASVAEAQFLVDDPGDPSRKLIRQVLGAVAEYERAMIRLRLRLGRRRKSEMGGYAFGAPPFGSRASDRKLIVDPEEQRTIARIRELRGSGASLRDVAAKLHSEGLRPKRGERWHPVVIQRILARSG